MWLVGVYSARRSIAERNADNALYARHEQLRVEPLVGVGSHIVHAGMALTAEPCSESCCLFGFNRLSLGYATSKKAEVACLGFYRFTRKF